MCSSHALPLPHCLPQRGGKRGSGAQQHGSGDMGG